MPRTALAILALTEDASAAITVSAADNTNGNSFTNAGDYKSPVKIVVTNTSGSVVNTVTLKAGAYSLDTVPGAAIKAHQGDLVVAVPVSSTVVITPTSARFLQADNAFYINFSASTATVYAIAQKHPFS